MSENIGYTTRKEFAKGFVRSFKQAIKLVERKSAGELLENNSRIWLDNLIAETEKMKSETTEVGGDGNSEN